jgi:hypothetical protein
MILAKHTPVRVKFFNKSQAMDTIYKMWSMCNPKDLCQVIDELISKPVRLLNEVEEHFNKIINS